MATMDANRLMKIEVTGKGLTRDLVESCTKASFSTSNSQVTELSLTFQDSMDLALFRSGILSSGASVNYGGWNMLSRVLSVKSGKAGPEVTIKAPSLFVERLRGQRGGYSWGERDVSAWARDMSLAVGMKPTIQPGLGKRTIVRAAITPGDQNPENSWDVMAAVAKAVGCWLFEYGPYLIMARPSWLIKQGWGGRLWDFGWNSWSDYSEGLAGMPEYNIDPNATPAESLTVKLLGSDADECRPGDTVGISGNVGGMTGRWLVTGVTYPMTVGDVVTATCVRPIDPVIPPEPAAKSAAGVSGAPGTLTHGDKNAPGVDGWMARTEGKAIDLDGAYGAQCVDLVQLYNTEFIRGAHISGNGNQWYDNPAVTASYERVYKDSPPEKGDIACWGSFYGGGYGHVAIVVANAGANVRVFTQNPGGAHYDTLSKQGLQGWLRPKKLTYGTPNNGVVKWF